MPLELIAVLGLIFLPAIIVSIEPSRLMRAILAVYIFILGLIIQINGGIVHGGIILTTTGSNLQYSGTDALGLLLLIFFTLGALVVAAEAALKNTARM